jgi:DNA-binding NarL/FixJ family response regulator
MMKERPALFLDAINTVATGGQYLHPEMRVGSVFRASPEAVSDLSARELEILRLLAAGRTMAQITDVGSR